MELGPQLGPQPQPGRDPSRPVQPEPKAPPPPVFPGLRPKVPARPAWLRWWRPRVSPHPASGRSSGSNRCAGCGGQLYGTQAKGEPYPGDHMPRCKFLDRALQVTRYVKKLEQVASESTSLDESGSDRRRYLQKSAKELSAAARAADPESAVRVLGERYAGECRDGARQAEVAEMLSQACQALARGEDPPPITLVPG